MTSAFFQDDNIMLYFKYKSQAVFTVPVPPSVQLPFAVREVREAAGLFCVCAEQSSASERNLCLGSVLPASPNRTLWRLRLGVAGAFEVVAF